MVKKLHGFGSVWGVFEQTPPVLIFAYTQKKEFARLHHLRFHKSAGG